MMMSHDRQVIFMGRSEKDLNALPAPVALLFRESLTLIAGGEKPDIVEGIKAKPLSGIGGGGAAVMELIRRHDTDTFRAVYSAKLGRNVYVLHCFMKKSKSGIALPKPDREMIERRLKTALEMIKYES